MDVKNCGNPHNRFQSQEMYLQQMMAKTPTKNSQIVQ
jgi:hypothetical protein